MSISTRLSAVHPVSGLTGTATPLWFGPTERPLFGWVHAPASGVACGAAVLCAPLAREQDIARYPFRRLAEELAARGILTVRFDYDGTGDSAGGEDDTGRVAAWQRSIEDASRLARNCGAQTLVLVGMRAGALLAASVARTTGATGLVAWDPCKSGRSFVREEHSLHRLTFGDSVARADEVELPGFVFSAKTVFDLGQLQTDVRGSSVARALVLTRHSASIPGPLADDLAECVVEREEAIGQEQLLEGNIVNQQIPLAAIDRIAAWVSASPAPSTFPAEVAATAHSTIRDEHGEKLTERVLRFGRSELFSIETTNSTAPTGPAVIFVNSSFDSHTGPHRLWVRLARRWASAGLRCIRLDLSGIGDSPSRAGLPEHVVRSPAAFDDLSDAAHALCPDDPSNVVFVGLCSGGYQALEAGLALKARGVYVVNPILRFRPPEMDDGPIDPRRRLCRPTTTVSRVARRLPDLPLLNGSRMQAWREVGFGGPPKDGDSGVRDLAESNVDTLCICGENEARAIELEMNGADHPEGFAVQVIPGLDHALLPAMQRNDVVDRLSDHVVGRYTLDSTSGHRSNATTRGVRP